MTDHDLLAQQRQHLANLLEAIQRRVYVLGQSENGIDWPLTADCLQQKWASKWSKRSHPPTNNSPNGKIPKPAPALRGAPARRMANRYRRLQQQKPVTPGSRTSQTTRNHAMTQRTRERLQQHITLMDKEDRHLLAVRGRGVSR